MGYGYTYVDPSTNVTINIADLFTDPSHVLIRDMRSNGHQYVSQLEQITAYKRYNLSVQFNAHAGYALPLNAKMLPYLYVGFLPASVASHRTTQGYRVNGVDRTFRNCDANPNSYFAFLFNHNRVAATPYNPTNSQLVSFTCVYLHFHCESLKSLQLRCSSYLHEQIYLSQTHIRAI